MKAVFFYQREQTKALLWHLASFSLIYDRGSIRHQRVPRVVHQAPEVVPNREKAWRLPNLELISLAPLLCEKHLGKCSDRETHSFVGLKLQLAQFTSLPVPHLCSLQSYGMTKLLQASTAVLWLILSATGLRLANISFTTNFQSISQYGGPNFSALLSVRFRSLFYRVFQNFARQCLSAVSQHLKFSADILFIWDW